MIWNPWRRARELQAELDHMVASRDGWRHRSLLAQDRYDKMHAMNVELRRALELYRNA